MKRNLIRLMVATTIVLSLAFVIMADTPAVVIKDIGCGVRDGAGGGVFTDRSQAVVTSSGNGKLTCQVKGVANPAGKAVIWNFANTGLLCGTPAGLTSDWQNTVSASGNVTLTCHVK